VDPKVILALGNTAMQSLLAKFSLKITQERGKAIEFDGRWIIPALHPAAVLRNPGDFKRLAADLSYAVSLSNGGRPKDPGETRYQVVRTEEDLIKACRVLKKHRTLAADIETSDVNPRKHWIQYLGICWEKNKVAIFPPRVRVGHGARNDRSVSSGAESTVSSGAGDDGVPVAELYRSTWTHPDFKALFEDPAITWVWHNGKFDTSFLQQVGLPARTDEDTMLLHYLLDEVRGTHDLKQLASDLLGAEDYDAIVKKYAGKGENGWAKIPPHILVPYLARDADYTFQIFPILRERVRKIPDLEELYTTLIIPASHFLQRVERAGMWVSFEHLEKVAAALAQEKDEVETRIQEIAEQYWDPDEYAKATDSKSIPLEFNPASPRQVSWLIYSRLRLRVPGRAGIRDTREETLRELPPHPLVTNLLKLRKINKQLQTYVEGILREVEADGRVHSTYLIHGTSTGRLSSRNPNAQNIPRDPLIRDIFQAPPGKILVEADFDQAELRMLAHLSRDEELLRIYREGRKLHDEVAADLYGPNYTEEQRMRAKAVNFGIVYGRTEFSLMHEFKIGLPEAQRMVHDWFARFPQAKRYIDACRNAPLQGKQLVSPFGRRRRFPFVPEASRKEIQNESANFAIQSGASDLTLLTAMTAEPELDRIDAKIVNLVHDSILVECPENQAITEKVLQVLQEASARVVKHRLKGILEFPMDAKVGRGWGTAMKGDGWWEYKAKMGDLERALGPQ
jgi:DNA polymerase-1